MASTIEKAYFSYSDLQARWGVSKRTIQREVLRGRLKRAYVAGLARFSSAAVMTYEREAGKRRVGST